MDELNRDELPVEEEKEVYTPRPAWQVWSARIGVVIMIVAVILYYLHIAGGGQL